MSRSKHSLLFAFLFFLTLSLAFLSWGCLSATDKANSSLTNEDLVVAVSIVPQEGLVKAVAGNLVKTLVLIPPGYSPGNYAPTPQELLGLSNATIYFSIGVAAEQENILPKLKDINSNISLINLADEVKKHYPEREFSSGGRDPHIWLSPKRAKIMVEVIASQLSQIDPAHEDEYQENAAAFIEELARLDSTISSVLDGLSCKTFIIYHPSLGYFADDYGLTMMALENSGKDADINSLKNVITAARENNIKTVFYQAEIDSKQAETVAKEIGGEAVEISPLAPDYTANLKRIAAALSHANAR